MTLSGGKGRCKRRGIVTSKKFFKMASVLSRADMMSFGTLALNHVVR